MAAWKMRLRRLVFPARWVMALLVPACTAALVVIFRRGLDTTPGAYVAYAVSAYTLMVVCVDGARTIPPLVRRGKAWFRGTSLGYRYTMDDRYRLRVSLHRSLMINFGYSVTKLALGIYYRSVWFGAVAVYYMVLSLMQFLLLRRGPGDLLAEYRRCRACAWLLLVLNVALSGIVVLVVWENAGSRYPGVLIFAVAAYTFYQIIRAIVGLVRYRSRKTPVLSTVTVIRFVKALVAILFLQTAMITQFGEGEELRLLMNSLTGAAVCLFVLNAAVFMIIRTNREIRGLQSNYKGVQER